MKNFSLIILSLFFVLLYNCEEPNKSPTCKIISPLDSASFEIGDVVTISVEADDADGNVTEVRFYIDEIGVGSSNTYPYKYDWDTNSEEESYHSIKATAKDNNGKSTSDEVKLFLVGFTGTVEDIDGNIYNTIRIGSVWWMTENLKTTHYSNGDEILDGTEVSDLEPLTEPKYWFAYNDSLHYVPIYGRLYTWYTINDSRNVCPDGWHVPSDAEWNELADSLGGSSVAGGKMKETGTSHWLAPNTGATDEIGFKALPGGVGAGKTYAAMGSSGVWWSSSEGLDSFGTDRSIYYLSTELYSANNIKKKSSRSVRCIKDQ